MCSVYGGIWGGGSGSEADGFGVNEPLGLQPACILDVMDAGAVAAAGGDEFAGIITVGAANDDDDITLLREFSCGGLALLGGAANGVNELHFRVRERPG